MKYKFSDVVDIPKLQKIMEAFNLATGIMMGIVDVDGNILVAVGWRDICTKFHRMNRETESLCIQSDKYINQYLKEHLSKKEPYITYKCANGLIDAAAPIIIDGEHLATIFEGQLLFEKPDEKYFRNQARKYGFDETEYLAALAEVPVISKDELDAIMTYFSELAHMLAQMGLAQLKLLESQAKALQENKERLSTIIDNTPNVAIRSYDMDGKILYWNKATEKIFSWTRDEILEKSLHQIMPKCKIKSKFDTMLKESDESNSPIGPIEWEFKNKDNAERLVYSTIFPVQIAGNKKEFIFMDVDITERKKLEKEMARIDQLNLVGEMAASIGHEVRNPMTTVRGYLQLLGGKDGFQQYKEQFDLMIEELDRANSIITEYLSLAKNKVIQLEMNNLNSIILAMKPLIEANAIIFNQSIKMELGQIPDLLLDANEIRQLIINLARNGIEAMSPQGQLIIKTYRENDEVVLAVQDEGKGIEPALFDKLGKPFFTTKDEGTGLGLAVCYSIAARHNAKVVIDSGLEGTTFYVRFKV